MCTLIREGICSDNLDLIQAVVDPVLKIIFLHLFTSFFFFWKHPNVWQLQVCEIQAAGFCSYSKFPHTNFHTNLRCRHSTISHHIIRGTKVLYLIVSLEMNSSFWHNWRQLSVFDTSSAYFHILSAFLYIYQVNILTFLTLVTLKGWRVIKPVIIIPSLLFRSCLPCFYPWISLACTRKTVSEMISSNT